LRRLSEGGRRSTDAIRRRDRSGAFIFYNQNWALAAMMAGSDGFPLYVDFGLMRFIIDQNI
jgi:hypothetical protein